MKKWMCLVLALLCVVFAGCHADTEDLTKDTTTNTTTPTTTTSAFISEEKAVEIAAEHWGIQPGDRDASTGFVMSIVVAEAPTADAPQYLMALQWLVENEDGTPSHQSRLDTVAIDAVTGEILVEPTE